MQGWGCAASPAGGGADELGHLLHVVCGQQHHLLVLREVLLEDLVQQPLPPQLRGNKARGAWETSDAIPAPWQHPSARPGNTHVGGDLLQLSQGHFVVHGADIPTEIIIF